jgi:hypothetical protein
VKCLFGHGPAECPFKDKEQKAKCTNCGGDHPANYRGCIFYKEFIVRRKQGIREEREKRAIVNESVVNYIKPNQSFAGLFRENNETCDIPSNSNISDFLNLSQNLFGKSFPEMIREINSFMADINKTKDRGEKQVMYMNFMMKLTSGSRRG